MFPARDAFTADRTTGAAYWFYGTLWVILADVHQTGGSFSLIEQWMREGVGPPLHVHSVDEWFFVLEGELDMQVADDRVIGHQGDSIWIPRGTPHGFAVGTGGAHVLNGYAPGGVEQVIVEVAMPAARAELPPEDLEIPSADQFVRLLNNWWSVPADASYARIEPLR